MSACSFCLDKYSPDPKKPFFAKRTPPPICGARFHFNLPYPAGTLAEKNMKKQKHQMATSHIKQKRNFLYALICATLFLGAGCEKSFQMNARKASSPPIPLLTAQEQALVGKWNLQGTETYEIAGVDSAGQYLCYLIGSASCDSVCPIELKNLLTGSGSIGGCDLYASFTWQAKQAGKLLTGSGTTYDILYLSNDSVAFSNVYTLDVLKLKSVAYYKRN